MLQKRFFLMSIMVLAVAACHKIPSPQDPDGEYMVYTTVAKEVNFNDFDTYTVADSLLVLGAKGEPQYSTSTNAMTLIAEFREQMNGRGFTYVADKNLADVGLQLSYIINTDVFTSYYTKPYWWLDFPGYWPSDYWGDWYGWYYNYPVTYTYTSTALLADIVDLKSDSGAGKKLEILWSAYIGGPSGYSISNDLQRMRTSVKRAFAQSPYLKSLD